MSRDCPFQPPTRTLAPLARARRGAFTFLEVLVAATVTAMLLVCVLTGLVSLQHGYAASEDYGTGQADQTRLLDYLALDLRRGIRVTGSSACYAMDPDGQGLKITVPDLYRFASGDPQHLNPLLVPPSYDASTQTAYYNGSGATVPAGGPYPYQTVVYRFNAASGVLTRSDPWQPLAPNGKGGYQAAAPAVIATHLEAFPQLTPDPNDLAGNTVRYAASFRGTFKTLSTAADGTEITLHHVTFIRSKNLAH